MWCYCRKSLPQTQTAVQISFLSLYPTPPHPVTPDLFKHGDTSQIPSFWFPVPVFITDFGLSWFWQVLNFPLCFFGGWRPSRLTSSSSCSLFLIWPLPGLRASPKPSPHVDPSPQIQTGSGLHVCFDLEVMILQWIQLIFALRKAGIQWMLSESNSADLFFSMLNQAPQLPSAILYIFCTYVPASSLRNLQGPFPFFLPRPHAPQPSSISAGPA